ncbi:uncharacterized protein LOC134285171 [Aedes albopictus]|uniref:Integrase catalytic domain-containing protein n=3 Tax=Aedes albopictus TaxID=7160 RepID=A0ABM1ZFP2_AEDAL
MVTMEEYKELKKQEKQLVGIMNGIARFVNEFQKGRHEIQIDVRLETLEEAMKKFYSVRRKIELYFDDEDSASEVKIAENTRSEREKRKKSFEESLYNVQEQYFEVKAALIQLRPKKETPRATIENVVEVQPVSRVKLPDIKLPSFSGRIQDWTSFRDTFRSLIHNNQQLADVDKFTYLRSSTTGEALQELNSVELTGDNYEVAWKMLEKKYENKKLIVKAHLDALFAVEPMRRENCEALSHIISEFDKNLLMLNKIGEQTANWSTILAYMVCSRLDQTTLRNWETRHNSKDVPKYDDLMQFLRDQCAVLQSIAPARVHESDRRPRLSTTHTTSQAQRRCLFCGDSYHLPFKCSKLQNMNVAQRVEDINRKRLCRNCPTSWLLGCLTAGHFAEGCTRGSCTRCGRKHHTLLHFDRPSSSGNPAKPSVPASVPQSVPQAQNRPNSVPTAHQQQPQQIRSKPQSQTQTPSTQPATQTQPTSSYPVIRSQNTHPQPTTDPQPAISLETTESPHGFGTTTRQVLMSTAVVKVVDRFGNTALARTLLDSCSEFCYMTSSFSKKLKFQAKTNFLKVQGIGNSSSTSTKSVEANIEPRHSSISSFGELMQFHVLPKITQALPLKPVWMDLLEIPSEIVLADPTFGEPGPIDLIIGAEFYFDLLRTGRRKLSDSGPTLQETVFGWVVSGKIPEMASSLLTTASYVCSTADLQEMIARFWDLETCHVNRTHSVEETACEEMFKQTTTRDEEGRFVVSLPKKEHMLERLGESRAIAMKLFIGLEKRFALNAELKESYKEFIHEYLLMGHMKEVDGEQAIGDPVYYMPHHAVLRPDSTTTKLRVVFDASCRTSSGISLNDALMVGPVVQNDLISTILRFRQHRIAVIADVAKMYRMVRVPEEDQHLQRILWRDTPEESVKTFELLTVTYGTASAPYLATRCLKKLGEDNGSTHPIAARVVQEDFYVDDMLSGADTVPKARQLMNEVIELTDTAGFTLRKWNSNSPELLSTLPKHLRDERSVLDLDSSSATVKTLGLRWDTQSDDFCFAFPEWRSNSSSITKRSVHSDAACFFDPLGLVGPVVVQAKIFIQRLWLLKCDWDDPLEESLQEMWMEYKQNMVALESLSIPRWLGVSNDCTEVQLHGFCDASEAAYGACLYLRCTASDGTVTVRLITSKSRVAPLESLQRKKKKMSIPRLELSSALLLSHLYEKYSQIHPNLPAYFWTDSMIVKCWLASLPSRWQIFVANRVSEIQHLTKDGVWNHVPGTENPADLISRGMSPAHLQYQTLWFEGPQWLAQDQQFWPDAGDPPNAELDSTMLEERPSPAFPAQAVPPSEIFGERSSFTELVRIVALLLRFRHNSQKCNRPSRKTGPLTLEEQEQATIALVRLSQQECYPQELKELAKRGSVHDSSNIAALHPQLCDGVMRVGGRLSKASISSDRKHPYILHHKHPLATMIVRHFHYKLFHAGQQLLISAVRGKFWPVHIHSLARKVIHGCIPCFRSKPKVLDQLMADLPSARVNPAPPFMNVGVDYCGPFQVNYPNRRASPVKCYVAIFVCLVVKAVHLELVMDLTTQAFLAALKRFAARRGKPQLIMCDNATTFVGAKRELTELHRLFHDQKFQEQLIKDTSSDGIEFRFIPPRTPNFGGLWEAQVKSFKGHFKKAVGTKVLKVDEMLTALAQIEAVLNSRPLTPISSDPSDFEALTPGHFLVQRPLTAIPEPDLQDLPTNRLSKWETAQQVSQQVWSRWSTQYLSDLHNRTKWTKQRNNIRIGTMVLLKDENAPPLKWHLGRVVKVFEGSDGNIRVVTVRTKDGCFDRGISKVCPLPIRDNEESPQLSPA